MEKFKNFLNIWIWYLIFNYCQVDVHGNFTPNSKCYEEISLDSMKFTVNPGSYDPNYLSPFTCMSACGKLSIGYAGMRDGSQCLCSVDDPGGASQNSPEMDNCNMDCTDTTDPYICGGYENYFLVEITKSSSISTVNLPLLPIIQTEYDINDVVSIEVANNSVDLSKLYYTVDNNGIKIYPREMKHEFNIFKPGNYSYEICYGDPGTSNCKDINIKIRDFEEMLTQVFINCENTTKVFEEVMCEVDIENSNSAELKIEGTQPFITKKFKVSDTMIDIQGISFNVRSEVPLESSEPYSAFVNSPIQYDGYLVGIDVLGTDDGTFTLKIYEGECVDPVGKCVLKNKQGNYISNIVIFLVRGYNHVTFHDDTKVKRGYYVAFVRGNLANIFYENADPSISDTDLSGNPLNKVHYLQTFVRIPYKISVPISYSVAVNATMRATLESRGGYATMDNSEIMVQEGINFTLKSVNPCFEEGQLAEFIIDVISGTDFTIYLDTGINNNSLLSRYVENSSSNKIFSMQQAYTEGVYVIRAFAKNAISEFEDYITICIQYPENGQWTFSYDPDITAPPGKLIIEASMENRIPTNETFSISYGDGEADELIPITYIGPGPYTQTFEHTYSTPGEYEITINASNIVSSFVYNKTVEFLTTFDDLIVQLTSLNSENGLKVEGKGVDKNIFQSSSAIYIEVSNNLKLDIFKSVMVEFVNGTEFTSQNSTAFDLPSLPTGTFNLQVFGLVNGVKLSPSTNITVSVLDKTEISSFNIIGWENKDLLEMVFELTFDEVNDGICAYITCESTNGYLASSQLYESLNNVRCQGIGVGSKPEPLAVYTRILVDFQIEDIYNCKAKVESDFGDMEEILDSLTIADIDCNNITISMDEERTIDSPLEFFRPDIIELIADVEVNCNITPEYRTEIRWVAIPVDNVTHEFSIDKEVLLSEKTAELKISGKRIPYGLNKIEFVFTLLGQKIPVRKKIETFVVIKASDLTVLMTNNLQTEFIRGETQTLGLTPLSSTINPNFVAGETEVRTVIYLCKKVGETFKINPEDYNELPKYSNDHEPKKSNAGLGGCFGKGPGLIDVKNIGDFIFILDQFDQIPGEYQIYTKVISKVDEYSASGVGVIRLKIVEGSVPILNIKCGYDSKCKIENNCYNVISNVDTGFELTWDVDWSGSTYSRFDIFSVDGNIETQIPNAYDDHMEELFHEFGKENGGAIKVNLKSSIYLAIHHHNKFIIKGFVSSDNVNFGMAGVCLTAKYPPVTRNCKVEEIPETSFIKRHKVTCDNFPDPNGIGITSYTFYGKDDDSGETYVLKVSKESSAEIVVPVDKSISLYVKVTNFDGASTSVLIEAGMKGTSSDTLFRNEDDLDTALIKAQFEGETSEMGQILSLKSSVLEQKVNTTFKETFSTDEPALEVETNELIREILHDYPDNEIDSSVGMSQMNNIISNVNKMNTTLTLENKDKLVDNLLQIGKDFSLEENNGNEESQLDLKLTTFTRALDAVNKEDASANPFFSRISPKDVDIFNEDMTNNINGYGEKSEAAKNEELRVNQRLTKKVSDELVSTVKKSLQVQLGTGKNHKKISTKEFEYEYIQGKSANWNPSIYSSPERIVCQLLNKENCTKIPHHIGSITFQLNCKNLYRTDMASRNHKDLSNKESQKFGAGVQESLTVVIGNEDTELMLPAFDNEYIFNTLNKCDNYNDEMEIVTPSLKENNFAVFHRVILDEKAISCFKLKFNSQPNNLIIFEKDSSKVHFTNFDFHELVNPTGNNLTGWNFEKCYGFGKGFKSIAIAQLSSGFNYLKSEKNFTMGDFSKELHPYHAQVFHEVCSYWNEKTQSWAKDGFMGFRMINGKKQCKWNHLTTFGSGFIIKPNTIDFDYVFDNADLEDNLTIYLTVIISFVLYILILIYARFKDKHDLEKIGSTPLPDNEPQSKYIYEILVFTGSKWNAGTKSKVRFILFGQKSDSKVRLFKDPKREIFMKANVNSFIMAEPRPLGNLKYMRIWHDNSGEGEDKSWYLDYIIIRDVQTSKKYHFISHQWFAVERDDGITDRVLPVSGEEERKRFGHLFKTTSNQKFRDDHLWLSIFLRPVRSRFTRVQRASSCMAMLYLSMLVNIMWYGRSSNTPTLGLKVGPFHLSPEQIGIGFMSNLIVFLPSILIVILFRKSRPKQLRPSKINEVLEGSDDNIDEDIEQNPTSGSNSSASGASNTNDEAMESFDDSIWSKKKRKRSFGLPYWCLYFAWLLTILSIGASLFFLWSYGISFGNEKTTKWFTSLIIAFVCSILLTQPLKVLLVSIFISLICKFDDYDEDDAYEDEEDPRLNFDEEWLHHSDEDVKRQYYPTNVGIDPALEYRSKIEREKEVKMMKILREVFAYVIFLLILLVISYGNSDPNRKILRDTINNGFLKPGDLYLDFYKVRSLEKFYLWLNEAFIPELMITDWYNSDPPNGLGGYIDDRANFLVGMPIMRQVRVKKNSCTIHRMVWDLTDNCAGFSKVFNEETRDFRVGWNLSTKAPQSYEYFYQPAHKVKGLPFWGELDWYGGGGYIYPFIHPLKGQQRHYKREMRKIREEGWINEDTRAIFFEFGIYNAQVNLFSYITFVFEMVPGGGLVPFERIEVLRLMRYHRGFGLFVVICEVCFMIFTLYFTVHEFKELFKKRRAYFRDPGNVLEMLIVLLGYISLILFIQKELITREIIDVFKRTNGTGYIRLQYVAAVDESLGYAVAILVFLANLKFLHLLRFNKRFGILSQTLIGCAAELSGFAVCLLIVFLAFVQLFYLILGFQMHDFSNFVSSVEASFSMMLGKFKFYEISMTAPFAGPVIFFIFALSTSLILINILLTIVIKTFFEVKESFMNQRSKYEILDFIKKRIMRALGISRSNRKILPSDADMKKRQRRFHNYYKNENGHAKDFSEKVEKLLNYVNTVCRNESVKVNDTRNFLFKKKIRKPKIFTDDI